MVAIVPILVLGILFFVSFFVALTNDQPKRLVVLRFFPVWMQRSGREQGQREVSTQRKAA